MTKIQNIKRRDFIRASAATALTIGAVGGVTANMKDKKPLDVLFLGGTGFIGPHMVRECLAQGHTVTLFNRGKRNSNIFSELETIIGNRDPEVDDGLNGLKGRKWDVVVDTSGYLPRHVNASAELLANAVSQYLFISTVSVYSDFSIKNMDEDAPLIKLDNPTVEQITGETYGGLKVLCEQAVTKHYGDAATILRPTYIVGPGDHTDRFIHYIHRPILGGRMAMPGKPDNPLSYVDVRDLAQFVARCLAKKVTGVFNMVEEPRAGNFGELISMSTSLSKSDVKITWLDSDFLAEQREKMGDRYAQFPMWHDQNSPDSSGSTSQTRAVAAGFTNRAFRQTVADTHGWWVKQAQERKDKRRVHISADFEKALLAAWDER